MTTILECAAPTVTPRIAIMKNRKTAIDLRNTRAITAQCKCGLNSPEMAHFFAQNILVPCALFSEN